MKKGSGMGTWEDQVVKGEAKERKRGREKSDVRRKRGEREREWGEK